MSDVIVDLRSIRIDVAPALVKAFYKGNETAQAEIYKLVKEKIEEYTAPNFIGDGLIENLEVEDEEEEYYSDKEMNMIQGDK